uniref:Uncharacterized protein n=1 Tax=Nymphaea colorata TaxID=210225 RepID=A0A5K1G1Z8_9MAGN
MAVQTQRRRNHSGSMRGNHRQMVTAEKESYFSLHTLASFREKGSPSTEQIARSGGAGASARAGDLGANGVGSRADRGDRSLGQSEQRSGSEAKRSEQLELGQTAAAETFWGWLGIAESSRNDPNDLKSHGMRSGRRAFERADEKDARADDAGAG